MPSLLRRRGGKGPDDIARHTVGNALVLHPQEAISPEAQSLALSVIEDADNDVVVLDLGDGMPITSWESMAGALPRRRRGIRLIACGRHQNAAAMAGQWLSERLNRTVVAPDGVLVRGAAGTLFVHSTSGSGWVRFRPGRAPEWDSKRYPKPQWDAAAVEHRATSSTGEIEPVPGGVWIHDTTDPVLVDQHRGRLVGGVPCQDETMTVLLGCPGTPPLSLDDVMRFWRELDEDSRRRARWVQYGEVRLPEGESFGQTLADLFQADVITYTGVPIGTPAKTEVLTVRADGTLGWPSFARELGYAPRAHPNSKARRASVLSHRGPLVWTEEVAPRVFWYAPDAVVEVVQSGLWIRSHEEPPNADRVRAAAIDPERSTIVFDDTTESTAHRMRELAQDLLARLDERTSDGSILLPASILAPGMPPAGRAQAVLTLEAEQTAPPAESIALMPVAEIVVPAAELSSGPISVEPVGIPAEPVMPARAVSEVVLQQVRPEPVAAEPSAPIEPVPAPVAPLPEPPALMLPVPAPPTAPVGVSTETVNEPVTAPVTAPVPQKAAAEAPTPAPKAKKRRGTHVQPVPAASASAAAGGKSLAEERSWLRRTLSRDFDQMASSVSRLMSEHPGMQTNGQTADDTLADAVALRLYLTRRGAAIDRGLRSGAAGPHVPFARCAAAGLSRLPSHRGTTVFTLTPTSEQWALYRDRKLVTEWGFVNALTAPCAAQEGTVDVMLWSMTARRSVLLEPEGDERTEDRVLFAPGTNFKILDLKEPAGEGRGFVLMREIGVNEIDVDGRVDSERVSLDELAITSLRRSAERWAESEPRKRVGVGAADRFDMLPGLTGGGETR